MSDLTYRILSDADIPAFRKLRRNALIKHPEAFAEAVEEFDAKSNDDLERMICDRSPEKLQFVVGAFDDDRLIGIAGCFQQEKVKLRHMASVWTVYVAEEYRGQNVGRMLMTMLLDKVRQVGEIEVVELGVAESSTAARRLYEELGFEAHGYEKGAMKVDGRYVDMVFMSQWLRPKPGNS